MTGLPFHPGRDALALAEDAVRRPPVNMPAADLAAHARTVRLWSSDLDAIAAADRIGTACAEGVLS